MEQMEQPLSADVNPPEEEAPKSVARKILNYTSWTILVLLAPITLLIFMSQNSLPGDFFYPIKRGLEGVVLAASSVSPATKVAFKTDLTNTRYKEAEALLLLAKSDTRGLSDFVTEVQTTQNDVLRLSNMEDRKRLSGELITKIDEYQQKLTQVQEKVAPAQPQSPFPQTPPTQTQNTTQPSSGEKIITVSPSPVSNVSSPTQSQQPQQQATTAPAQPSSGSPPSGGIPQAVSTPPNAEKQRVAQKIEITRLQLENVKKNLKEHEEKTKEEKETQENKKDQEEKKGRNGKNQ